jgi:chorismate dehydratase
MIKELRAGRYDAALVSSIEAFRWPGYRVVSELGICSRGPVRSVRAFLRGAPKDVQTVGLDSGSETSVTLLKILLNRRFGVGDCQFERVTPTTRPDELPHDLVMFIGDVGLAAACQQRQALDLGELWQEWVGLPFVYAAWLLPPGADAERILPILRAAHARGVERGQDDKTGGAVHYEMGEAERRGLARLHTEAASLDLADANITPTFINEFVSNMES